MNAKEHSDYIVTVAVNWWAWVPILAIVMVIAGFFISKHFKKKNSNQSTAQTRRKWRSRAEFGRLIPSCTSNIERILFGMTTQCCSP
jgi:Ni,Fe-hydrogenase I cytochrome b subunit